MNANPAPSAAATRRVQVFDTTLRDGEQAPGCSMSRAQKLHMAQVIEDLGVDVEPLGCARFEFEESLGVAQGRVPHGLPGQVQHQPGQKTDEKRQQADLAHAAGATRCLAVIDSAHAATG